MKLTNDMLSDYCKNISEKYNISTGLVSKLIPTLGNKEKYVLHYRNIQLYTDLGLKVTKVHRVLEFNQSPWLKEYIDFNTEKRKNAKNERQMKLTRFIFSRRFEVIVTPLSSDKYLQVLGFK